MDWELEWVDGLGARMGGWMQWVRVRVGDRWGVG